MDIKTVLASVAASTAAVVVTVPAMVSFVTLQAASPGTVETGNTNISGNSIAGRFGAGTTPTLARVQVNETGTLQGVRSITTTGTALLAQSTTASGGGIGGYFTSAAPGGRAIVADELSGTGNTIAGLFTSRSISNGIGVWARATGASGATIGVKGETASPNGTAGAFSNSSSGTKADLAGAGVNALVAKGDIKRDYGASNFSCVPIAYGWVSSAGAVNSGTGNFTVSKTGTGVYQIAIAGVSYNITTGDTATASPLSPGKYFVQVDSLPPKLYIATFDTAGAAADKQFCFVAYSKGGSPLDSPPLPKHARGIPTSLFAEKYPDEAARYFEECRKLSDSQTPPQ